MQRHVTRCAGVRWLVLALGLGCGLAGRAARAVTYTLVEAGSTHPGSGGFAGFDLFEAGHPAPGTTEFPYLQTFTAGHDGNLSTVHFGYFEADPYSTSWDAVIGPFSVYNLGPAGYQPGQTLAAGAPGVKWAWELPYELPHAITPGNNAYGYGTGAIRFDGSGPPQFGVVQAGDVIAVVFDGRITDPNAPPEVQLGRPYGDASGPAPYAGGSAYMIDPVTGLVTEKPDRDYWVEWEIYVEDSGLRFGSVGAVPEPASLALAAVAFLALAVARRLR
ncbi:MAG: PEP-CTERM sorting domain-containing protein [Planctomycetota bacterium]|nr:MAG: PEP-CTERM sorting domain-containing protein [Planctomycetota bacterium]